MKVYIWVISLIPHGRQPFFQDFQVGLFRVLQAFSRPYIHSRIQKLPAEYVKAVDLPDWIFSQLIADIRFRCAGQLMESPYFFGNKLSVLLSRLKVNLFCQLQKLLLPFFAVKRLLDLGDFLPGLKAKKNRRDIFPVRTVKGDTGGYGSQITHLGADLLGGAHSFRNQDVKLPRFHPLSFREIQTIHSLSHRLSFLLLPVLHLSWKTCLKSLKDREQLFFIKCKIFSLPAEHGHKQIRFRAVLHCHKQVIQPC